MGGLVRYVIGMIYYFRKRKLVVFVFVREIFKWAPFFFPFILILIVGYS